MLLSCRCRNYWISHGELQRDGEHGNFGKLEGRAPARPPAVENNLMRYRIFLLSVLAFLLILPGTAWAKKHKHAEKGVIMTEVNEAAKTVVLTIPGGKGSLSYSLPSSATITVDEAPAKFDDLHKGMHVTTYTEADEHVLSQIDVQSTK